MAPRSTSIFRFLHTRLAKRLAGTFFLRLSAIGLSFLTSILLARILGMQEYGIYTYVLMLISIIGTPVALALPNLVMRQAAAYQATSSWPLLKGIRRWAGIYTLAGSLVIVLLSGITAWYVRHSLDEHQYYTFLLALAVLPIQAFNALRAALLKGLHHIVLGQIPETLIRPVTFIALLLASQLIFDIQPLNSRNAVAFFILANAGALIIGTGLLIKRIPSQLKAAVPEFDASSWLPSVAAFSFSGGLKHINKQLPILLLGPLAGVESVAIFVVASRGAELIAFVLTAMNIVLAPMFSKLYASGEIAKLQRIVTTSSRLILVVSLPVAIFMIIYAHPLLEVIFGPEYAAGASTLVILSIGQLVHAAAGSVGLLLNMTAHEKLAANGFVAAAVVNLLLNVTLIPIWGIEGSALAVVASTVTWNLLAAIWTYKKLHIYPTALGRYLLPKRW